MLFKDKSRLNDVYSLVMNMTLNQRTNGPVNTHLRPEIYTNKLV